MQRIVSVFIFGLMLAGAWPCPAWAGPFKFTIIGPDVFFNDINSDDDFDISCNDSARTGTRVTKRTCRPEYANDATRRAGRDLARRLQGCQGGTDACIEQAMQAGTADAQEQVAVITYMDGRLDDEFRRLVRERPELMMAVYEFLRKENEYKEAAAARQD